VSTAITEDDRITLQSLKIDEIANCKQQVELLRKTE
jgi:hypothetical protein